jgi:5-methylcytosine-specific restriction protein A
VAKKKKVKCSSSLSWRRDPEMGYTAIYNAEFKCENNPDHITFVSSVTSKQFVEAHHLIPMELQDRFEANIDVPENIISLCPNCHRAFHNSIDETKIALIIKFYLLRKDLLAEIEIIVDQNKILEYYKTTFN